MAQIRFTQNIQRHVPCPPAHVTASTVREALDAYFEIHSRAKGYVLDDQRALRKHMAVFINGVQIKDRDTLSDTLQSDDLLDVMQALSGG
ncbi:MAG: MoaD/ThiS family protein [Planctomycetota bacterium]|nr:MoaD/ThiS family protein [Planctomycetota bacterium]